MIFEVGDTIKCEMYDRTFKTCGVVRPTALIKFCDEILITFIPRPAKGDKMFFNNSFTLFVQANRLEFSRILLTEKRYDSHDTSALL